MNCTSTALLLSFALLLLAINQSTADEPLLKAQSLSTNSSGFPLLSALQSAPEPPPAGQIYLISLQTISQIKKDLDNLTSSSDAAGKGPLGISSGGEVTASVKVDGEGQMLSAQEEIFNPAADMDNVPVIPIAEDAGDGSRQSSGGVTVVWQP